MEHLELPSQEVWNSRKEWFENLVLEYEEKGSHLVSEQACALIAEVESCFCVGAWISVIILAFTVIDAQLRETELPGIRVNSKKLLEMLGFDLRFQQLRLRRNQLVHTDIDTPAITVDQQWNQRKRLEEEARDAVNLMLEAFFSNPGV